MTETNKFYYYEDVEKYYKDDLVFEITFIEDNKLQKLYLRISSFEFVDIDLLNHSIPFENVVKIERCY